jgi:hypothetical protein
VWQSQVDEAILMGWCSRVLRASVQVDGDEERVGCQMRGSDLAMKVAAATGIVQYKNAYQCAD